MVSIVSPMNDRAPVPGSWQETMQSFSTMGGENADARYGLWLSFGAVLLSGCGWPLALVGLCFSLGALFRSGRLGGRKAAVAGVILNAGIVATHVVMWLVF